MVSTEAGKGMEQRLCRMGLCVTAPSSTHSSWKCMLAGWRSNFLKKRGQLA